MRDGDGIRGLLDRAEVVFWDFDGVVKDSVQAKTDGFAAVFEPYGSTVVAEVVAHHEANGGMSRFEKIPRYLRWAGEQPTDEAIADHCAQFARVVVDAVVDAPWVPGVREYLLDGRDRRRFVLVTATPDDEIHVIIARVGLEGCFERIIGAPTPKGEAIGRTLSDWSVAADEAVMVGDAEADLRAAEVNAVPFALRRTPLNVHLQKDFDGPMFEDLRG